jgi:hypothetical protein
MCISGREICTGRKRRERRNPVGIGGGAATTTATATATARKVGARCRRRIGRAAGADTPATNRVAPVSLTHTVSNLRPGRYSLRQHLSREGGVRADAGRNHPQTRYQQ